MQRAAHVPAPPTHADTQERACNDRSTTVRSGSARTHTCPTAEVRRQDRGGHGA